MNQQCGEHSGIVVEVNNLKEGQKSIWAAIDKLRGLHIATMSSAIIGMAGLLVQIGFYLIGKH